MILQLSKRLRNIFNLIQLIEDNEENGICSGYYTSKSDAVVELKE